MNGEQHHYDGWANGQAFCTCGSVFDSVQQFERHAGLTIPSPTPVPSEVAETTAGEREVEAAEGCGATRGYCACDRPKDGHRHHHCPECATHPNGGWAFSTWVDNPKIRPQDRAHESMHEYATGDPWASAPAEPDAREVEALIGLIEARAELREVYRVWSERRQNLSDLTRRLDENARQIADALTPALFDRVRREEGAKVLREAADALVWVRPERSPCDNPEWCCGSAGSCDAMHPTTKVVGEGWLRARAASVGRGEGGA